MPVILLTGLHVALNWDWVAAVLGARFQPTLASARETAGRTLALLLAATAIGAAVFQLVNTAPPYTTPRPAARRTNDPAVSGTLCRGPRDISGKCRPAVRAGSAQIHRNLLRGAASASKLTLIEENRAEANQPGVDDFIDGARRRGLCFMYDRTIEASLEQRAQSGMTKVPGEVALFGTPQNGGGVKFTHTRRNHCAPE